MATKQLQFGINLHTFKVAFMKWNQTRWNLLPLRELMNTQWDLHGLKFHQYFESGSRTPTESQRNIWAGWGEGAAMVSYLVSVGFYLRSC